MATTGYSNPIIPGFHPDPSVCRVDDGYFLVTSSFTYFPGVPIFRSDNLVDWTQIGNVLDRPSQLDLSETHEFASMGVFAPTLRHHDGRFWLITTVFTRNGPHNFFVTAEDPAGPWSDPVAVSLLGIDPDLAWDADGNCFVHYSSDQRIERCRIDPATGAVLDGPDVTWSGTGLQYPEAPHLFERAGTWYLLIAEGGTERGHAVSIARGPSPLGPWESCPGNPILSHRSTNLPIQNTGHADLVEATDGSWWMVLLGVRPRGASPRFHVLGRETFLAPVAWVDGWPTVDHLSIAMDRRPPGPASQLKGDARDDFDERALHPRWMSVRQAPSDIASLDNRPGWITLHGSDATLDSTKPVFIGRRQQHRRCRVRALVDAADADEAGLAVLMDEHHHYEVGVTGGKIVVRARIGPLSEVVGESARPPGALVLVVQTVRHRFGPDGLALGFETDDGEVQVVAELDGRYVSTEVAGGMLGRVIGVYAVGGQAAFDWFDYEEIESRR